MARRLDDLLLEEGALDEPRLKQARRHARQHELSLARALVDLRLIGEGALADVLVRRLSLPRVDLQGESVDVDALREVPQDLAERRRLLPLSVDRGTHHRTIRVAMADPLDVDALDEIELTTGCEVRPVIALASDLAEAVRRHYRGLTTKIVPRQTEAVQRAPTTKPTHQLLDEVSAALKLEALVDLLVERGAITREAFVDAVRALAKRQAGE
jgi:hypothetical protein